MIEAGDRRKLSVSQLKSYTRCPEQFRIEKFSDPRPPRRPAAWTVLGSALHEVFEDWENSERTTDPVEEFGPVYDRMIAEEMELQPDISLWMKVPRTKTVSADIANYRKRGLTRDVPQYKQRCLEAEWKIATLPNGVKAVELPFEIELAGITVRGHIDKVMFYPSMGVNVTEDIKTGSPDEEDDVRQLALYRLAGKEVYDLDVTFGRYFFTKLDRPGSWVDLTKYTRRYLEDTYSTLERAIDNKIFLPSPGKKCGLCGVKELCREMGNPEKEFPF